jgi:hypothetical protein
MRLIKYLTYSGLNVTIKFNPCHWRIAFNKGSSVEVWDVEHSYVLELLPITVRFWIDDGSW